MSVCMGYFVSHLFLILLYWIIQKWAEKQEVASDSLARVVWVIHLCKMYRGNHESLTKWRRGAGCLVGQRRLTYLKEAMKVQVLVLHLWDMFRELHTFLNKKIKIIYLITLLLFMDAHMCNAFKKCLYVLTGGIKKNIWTK